MDNIKKLRNIAWGGDELAWLQSWGATSNYIEDAWQEVLVAQGYSNYIQQGQKDWLTAQTGIENRTDAEYFALNNGLYTFATRLLNFDGNEGITLNGSDVSDWTDTQVSQVVSQSTATKQPAYSSGEIIFTRADDTNLISSGHISALDFGTGAFTNVLVFKTSFDFSSGASQSGGMVNTGNTAGFAGFFMSFINTNKVAFGRRTDLVTSSTISNSTLNDGSVHVGHMIFDGTTARMAIDGVIQTDTNTTAVDLDGTGSGKLLFGVPQGIAGFEYDGSLYQFRSYSGAKKDGEILLEATNLLEQWS